MSLALGADEACSSATHQTPEKSTVVEQDALGQKCQACGSGQRC